LKNAHIESLVAPQKVPDNLNVAQQHRCYFEEKRVGDEREIHVTAEFRFSASKKDDGESADVVKLEAAFVLVYQLPDEATFDNRCAKYFAELNGAYNAWPYWRELVQTATGRVGLGTVMIPVYRPQITEVTDAQDQAENQPV
jgi:hypothetical protein